MKELVLPRAVRVVIWQWPEHRVLWGKELPQGTLVSVVWETDDGAITCALGGGHYFVLWPEKADVAR